MTTGAAVNEVNEVGAAKPLSPFCVGVPSGGGGRSWFFMGVYCVSGEVEVGARRFWWAFVVFRVRSSYLVVGACHDSWVGVGARHFSYVVGVGARHLPMTWQRHGRRPSFLARRAAYPYVGWAPLSFVAWVCGSSLAGVTWHGRCRRWAVSTVGGVDGRRYRWWAVSWWVDANGKPTADVGRRRW
jgi:hypothetical protein